MRRILCLLLVTLLALSTVGYAGESQEEEIVFADPVLENIMRKLVDNPEGALTRESLKAVENLNIGIDGENTPEDEKIHDLTGLQYCMNLSGLALYGHAVEDISPLAGLTGLKYLDLGAFEPARAP